MIISKLKQWTKDGLQRTVNIIVHICVVYRGVDSSNIMCSEFVGWSGVRPSIAVFYFNILNCDEFVHFLLYACLQTGRIMVWWCPSVRVSVRRFPHFSPTCFDILSWNFAHDFVLMYYRSSLSVVNLCQVLWELCPFWNLEYWKYTVFRTFLLHALTYWAEILHMTLF